MELLAPAAETHAGLTLQDAGKGARSNGDAPAPIVDGHAVLPAAAGQFEVARARIEEEITALDVDRLRARFIAALDHPAGHIGGNVDAIVEAPLERIEHRLAGRIARETDQDDLTNIRFAVAVGVLEVTDIRHGTDEDAAVPATEGNRSIEVVHENRALVITARALRVR